jgi:DNA-binding transcriptional ArsR family regulator
VSLPVPQDIGEKVLRLLADSDARAIMVAVHKKEMKATTIAESLKIPLPTVYRKVAEMKEAGLLMVSRFLFNDSGGRESFYVCAVEGYEARFTDGRLELRLYPSAESQGQRWYEKFRS